MHPSSTSCDYRRAGGCRSLLSRYLRRFGWPSQAHKPPDARHATRSLSGAQARTSVSGAGLGGQDAASATSNNTAGRRIPQPPHAKVTGRWLASSTRAHMLPNRLARLARPSRDNAVFGVEFSVNLRFAASPSRRRWPSPMARVSSGCRRGSGSRSTRRARGRGAWSRGSARRFEREEAHSPAPRTVAADSTGTAS